MKNFIQLGFLFLTQIIFSQEIPKVVSVKIERLENFKSKYVTSRNVDVWLPENYSDSKKYAVLYMNDGQALFDSETTWNKQAWEVDDVLSKLIKENKIQDVIVVGIWNGGLTRHIDYFPQKPFESLNKQQQDSIYNANRSNGQSVFNSQKINSDNYLKFIVKELKPLIDEKYAVYTDQKHTFIAGSSMGGLISMYAICEYPKIFGGAVCMSTHWPGIFTLEKNPIPNAFFNYLKKHLPNPKNHKFYFDYGTATLDALYQTLQPKVDEIMKEKGFNSTNCKTQKFDGDDHSEKSWSKRFYIPMEFILKN
ncbi:alpha/beta hydrolase-fold protein [Flavobacterium sp. SUN052]|uniref:alpha/beta hydrolase n=1 Tax=Flavobacterium sp. SUN052 TaxID=3002441 RepID=UPI00237DDD37|nr:alpha/beta hydrolase-fold protein [Flavobacterium sp. SUN052]MEC4003606.1 alpha/beta hydrolase-fold protein [Flavobacterium sp. SUN052]